MSTTMLPTCSETVSPASITAAIDCSIKPRQSWRENGMPGRNTLL
jgi:hypothetical protein